MYVCGCVGGEVLCCFCCVVVVEYFDYGGFKVV